jgi:hypothetical protein
MGRSASSASGRGDAEFPAIAALAAEHVEVACTRVAPQHLLHLHCQAVQAAAQCHGAGVAAHSHRGAIRQHNLDRLVGRPLDAPGRRRRHRNRSRHGQGCIWNHLQRQERCWRQTPEFTAADLPQPVPQQAMAHVMPPGNRDEAGTRRLRHDPQRLLQPPPTTILNPGDDLHPQLDCWP